MFKLPNGEHALDALMNAIDHEMEVDAFLSGDSTDLIEAYDNGVIDSTCITGNEALASREVFKRTFNMD